MAMDMFTAGTTYSPYTGNTPITQIDTRITDEYDGAKNLQAQIQGHSGKTTSSVMPQSWKT